MPCIKSITGKRYLLPIVVTMMLLSGCQNQAIEQEIVILSTNDIHGNLERFPKLATLVQRTREQFPNVILVDAGDRVTGNPYVDYAREKGKPIISLMNSLGYDIATIGNHEFDFGQKILRERINDADFPILCANINSSRALLDSIPSHATIEVAGIKLCFLGLIHIDSDGLPATNPALLDDITFDRFDQNVSRYKELKKKCDVLIGLTHLGVYNDSILATRVPELDLIIGGHSHTLLMQPKIVNNVMISQAGAKLERAGITFLTFRGKQLVGRSFHTVFLDSITPPDSLTAAQVEQFNNEPEFKRVIGLLPAPPLSKEAIAGVVTEAMTVASRCDFAFYNQKGIRVATLPRREVTLEDILRIDPFGNCIVVHELTTEEMKALILNRFNATSGNPPVDLFMFPGKYDIVTDRYNRGIDVRIFDKNGRPLVDGERHRVALNQYVSVEYDFAGKGKGTLTNTTVVEAMVQFLKR